jgi:hypothetical protein
MTILILFCFFKEKIFKFSNLKYWLKYFNMIQAQKHQNLVKISPETAKESENFYDIFGFFL